MNKIPLSLWKDIATTKKSRGLYQTVRDLGKDHGPEDPHWGLESSSIRRGPWGPDFTWDYTKDESGQSSKCMSFIVGWSELIEIQYANLIFNEGDEPICCVDFSVSEGLKLNPGSNVFQELNQCSKVLIYFPTIPHTQQLNKGQADFSALPEHKAMEMTIRVYQDCCPETLWFIEEVARALHEKAKTKAVVNLEPS